MSPTASVSEIELSGLSTLRFFKGLYLLGGAFVTLVGLAVFTDRFRALPESGSANATVGVVVLAVSALIFYRVVSLVQVTASATGLRVGESQIPWPDVTHLVVTYRGYTTIDHVGGTVRTLYALPWPPGVPDHLEEVVSWWGEHVEIERSWWLVARSYTAVRGAAARSAV